MSRVLPPAPLHRVATVLRSQPGNIPPPRREDYGLSPNVTRLSVGRVQTLINQGRVSQPEEEGVCPICQTDWHDLHDGKVSLGCAHHICSSCFQESSRRGLRTCPLCRHDLSRLIAPRHSENDVPVLLMAQFETTVEQQRQLLVTRQRERLRNVHPLVIPLEEEQDFPNIFHLRTPVTPM